VELLQIGESRTRGAKRALWPVRVASNASAIRGGHRTPDPTGETTAHNDLQNDRDLVT